MAKLSDIYWLAGLWEGEGSFSVAQPSPKNRAKHPHIEMTLMMTDEDVVARAAAILRTKIYGPYGPYKSCRKPCWQIRITRGKAAAWMMTLFTLMGERRRIAIREALAVWKYNQPEIS